MNWGTTMKDLDFLKGFGSRIRELRKQRRWTQKELAAKLSVRSPQLNKYECGLHAPPLDKLLQLADVLTTTVDYLLTGQQTDAKPLHNHRLLELFRVLQGFENNDQEAVIRLIDGLIVKNRVEGALKIA